MSAYDNVRVTEHLADLGLSTHEAAIYLAVLEEREASAGQVLDKVSLHREQVYRGLKRLVGDNLLTTYVKRRRSYYAAVDPIILVRRLQAKISLAQSIMPYLQQQRLQKRQTIQVFEGADAVARLLEDIVVTVARKAEYLILGGAGDSFYESAKIVLPRYAKLFQDRYITARMIAYTDQVYTKEQELMPGLQLRRINQPKSGPTSTVVYGDKVAIEVFDPHNLAVIIIQNKFIADSYRQTFAMLWNRL
jgi:sugar-specific transcriptional regulator TrmB